MLQWENIFIDFKIAYDSILRDGLKDKQETLYVVIISMTCSTLASLWKFQYFRRPVHDPVKHLWWRFSCDNSKQLSIFTKNHYHRCSLVFRILHSFTWRLFKLFLVKTFLLLIHQVFPWIEQKYLLMSKFKWKNNLEHKLNIILNYA